MRNAFRLIVAACAALLLLPLMPVANAQSAPTKPVKPAVRVPHPIVTLQTAKGTILIKLFPEEAPLTCQNFIKLIHKKFYDGLLFHRVEPGFVIQGGDPAGNGGGGPGYKIKNESNKLLKHNRGAVAMANAGRDTAGSQFYIVITKPAPHLDEKEADGVSKYTIFGQVISGQDVAEKIQKGDKMTKITVKLP